MMQSFMPALGWEVYRADVPWWTFLTLAELSGQVCWNDRWGPHCCSSVFFSTWKDREASSENWGFWFILLRRNKASVIEAELLQSCRGEELPECHKAFCTCPRVNVCECWTVRMEWL